MSLNIQQPVVCQTADGTGDGQSQKMQIFNDSTHVLVIEIMNESPNLQFRSDPRSNTKVEITPTDQYSHIVIRAVDSTEKTVMHVSFYSKNEHSWIVTDAGIIRQKLGSEFPVADDFDNSETESHWKSEDGFERNRCDQIKQWVSGSPDMDGASSSSMQDDEKEYFSLQKRPFTTEGLTSPMRIVAHLMIEWITWENLYKRVRKGTILRANSRCLEQLDGFKRAKPSINGLTKPESFRLDLQRSQKEVPYDVFAIQYGNNFHFCSVFIWQHASNIYPDLLRESFKYSLKYGVEVWICVDESRNTRNPPDTEASLSYKSIRVAEEMGVGLFFHSWKRDRN